MDEIPSLNTTLSCQATAHCLMSVENKCLVLDGLLDRWFDSVLEVTAVKAGLMSRTGVID